MDVERLMLLGVLGTERLATLRDIAYGGARLAFESSLLGASKWAADSQAAAAAAEAEAEAAAEAVTYCATSSWPQGCSTAY